MMIGRKRSRSYVATVIVVAATALSACGVGGESSSNPTEHGAIPYVSVEFDRLREPIARLIPPEWDSLLSVVAVDGKPAAAANSGELFVLGTVTDVTPGASYFWIMGESGPVEQVAVTPGDPQAAIDTAIVEVAVDVGSDAAGGAVPTGTRVSFGLSFLPGVDIDKVKSDLMAHEGVAVVLLRGYAFPGNPEAWDVLGDGDFMGMVDAGRISFPLLEPGIYPRGFVARGIPVESVTSRVPQR